MHKTLAKPIFYYGSEAWTLRKTQEKRLIANKITFMRYIAGYTRWDHKLNEGVSYEYKKVSKNYVLLLSTRKTIFELANEALG